MAKKDQNYPNKYWNHEIVDKQMLANAKTQGSKKIWNYFFSVVKSRAYRQRIQKIRKKYKITGAESDTVVCNPSAALGTDIEKLCNDFSLHFIDWQDYILADLYFKPIEPYDDLVGNNLCRFLDLEDDILNAYFTEDWEKRLSDAMLSELRAFPLAITISPYASQRDITDYVKKMFPMIKAWQEKRKDKGVKIGQVRSGNPKVRERDEFIYQNRNKTGKEVKRLVFQKFGVNLPYEYIPKIISREKKKRQKM